MEVSGKRLDEDTLSEFCQPCLEGNVSTHANGYCIDCEEYMCQTCFSNHLKLKLGKNHVFGAITGDQGRGKQKQEEKCKKHTREAIKYYCRNHDFVGCGDCIVSDHGTCKPEFIRDLAKKFEESSEFKALLRQIQKWEADKAESETRIKSNRNENKTNFDKAIIEIKKFRREINIWLDRMEQSIEAEAKEISDGNEMSLSELEKKINNVNDEIVKIKRELDTHVYQADKLFIRIVECKPKIGVIEKSVSEIKSDDAIKNYSFEPETKVKEMLTSSVKLGIIRIASMKKAENKPTTEAVFYANNVFQLPDPRAAGFDVGKRVVHAYISFQLIDRHCCSTTLSNSSSAGESESNISLNTTSHFEEDSQGQAFINFDESFDSLTDSEVLQSGTKLGSLNTEEDQNKVSVDNDITMFQDSTDCNGFVTMCNSTNKRCLSNTNAPPDVQVISISIEFKFLEI